MRRNITKNEIQLLSRVWNAWMCLESIQKLSAKGLFDAEKTGNKVRIRKQFKKPSGNGEFSAIACSGHIENGSKCPDSLLLSKQPPKWCIRVLGFWSSSVFFSKLNCDLSKKNEAEKKLFSLEFAHFLPKNVIFATRLPFVNRQLLLNNTFWKGVW